MVGLRTSDARALQEQRGYGRTCICCGLRVGELTGIVEGGEARREGGDI